jgi:hypothetical protein
MLVAMVSIQQKKSNTKKAENTKNTPLSYLAILAAGCAGACAVTSHGALGRLSQRSMFFFK